MRVLSFTRDAASLTPDEAEMVAVFRQSRRPTELLQLARRFVADEQPKPIRDASLRIERLHSGPKRTFWCDVARSYRQVPPTEVSILDVRDFAEEYLRVFLAERQLSEPNEPALYEVHGIESSGRVHRSFYVRIGNYRAYLWGIPQDAWAEWQSSESENSTGGAR